MPTELPGKDKIRLVSDHLKPYIHRTPVMTSGVINDITGTELYFKCENFQKTGSFKIRGAMNAVLQLTASQKAMGVITHSSGNFAQALAYAAKCAGINATIVMPESVVTAKRDAVLGYGAEIVYSGSQPYEREAKCEEMQRNSGAVFIHPSNDINVIAGHTSCAVEFIEDAESLDAVIAPLGGGGLLSGIALGFRNFSMPTLIYAGEPLNASDGYESKKAGRIVPVKDPNTIADGLRTSLGDVTFPIIDRFVKEIITVSEDEIINAMKLIWERMKIVIEPSSAVAFAALLKNISGFKNKKIGIIVSGGNVDLARLPF
ncbi:MAG TPA: pyridoxal-phosphate dependent enzyme [Ignavibacteria bacterium]|nr:serine dehydratase [Bacteroidota bacterium]HRE09187.1 pyridoxal-phosphate dependent enzyme [Ignavibacteria bacterium]HRF66149.1 pyridoxal-phosphate dependent enzyme [Ignavibacteria bacterium]HRJ03475.1 pyridoxal-phosphate dependent enzyme [Ignavibacteria bacterium]HRJ84059.1 pyridoxal-phosphate dependent enzyme [Ignavibacteria bacterium]